MIMQTGDVEVEARDRREVAEIFTISHNIHVQKKKEGGGGKKA
jgi:hypothetical protein